MWLNGKAHWRFLVIGFFLTAILLQIGSQGSAFAQGRQADVVAPFPRNYPLPNGGQVTLFQPQIESWAAQTHIVALSAVAYAARSGVKPVMGSIKIEADTEIAIDDRLVRFKDFTIPEVNFRLSHEMIPE